jgi:hypothetical protein
MPKQVSIVKLKGTMGGITFYKSVDGHLAREKGGIDGKRIATDPNFQRTRENGSEFGAAGKAGKVLRNALREVVQNAQDNRMVSRLTKKMMEVIHADQTSARGERNVIDGEIALIDGFEFNLNGKLGNSLFAPYLASIDRVTGKLDVTIAPFVAAKLVSVPGGTTHFKIISAGAAIDFEKESFESASSASDVLPWDETATAAITLSNAISANSTQPLVLALGIEFYQEVNGTMYSLKNGAFNPLAVVKVEG